MRIKAQQKLFYRKKGEEKGVLPGKPRGEQSKLSLTK